MSALSIFIMRMSLLRAIFVVRLSTVPGHKALSILIASSKDCRYYNICLLLFVASLQLLYNGVVSVKIMSQR